MRPRAACGMKLRSAPPPWNAAWALSDRRRPFIRVRVREAPKPRRLIDAVPAPAMYEPVTTTSLTSGAVVAAAAALAALAAWAEAGWLRPSARAAASTEPP